MTTRIFFFLFALLPALASAQLTQTIRGQVVDKNVQSPLPGAVITIPGTQPLKATGADANGYFKIEGVPVGRQAVRVTFIGYKPFVLTNLDVTSGKEIVLTIGMEEDLKQLEEVVISANSRKDLPQNDMSTVSTRTFSVEETQRYAAAVNDPARMALSFAGVTSPDDGNNEIIIRGNAPNGLLWRMDGIDIPSPNHFSDEGTSGGGISILSAQLLANSDFSTGAFAPEYGNALSGVFDLKLRKGNNEKREHTFQAGVLGIDVASEGPLGKNGGSYLVNYRYSTLGILGKIGVPLGDAVTTFQDLAFNLNLPTKNAGTFGIFGFGGLSNQYLDAKRDSADWESEDDRFYGHFKAHTGMGSINHSLRLNDKMYLRTAVAGSAAFNSFFWKRINDSYNDETYYDMYFMRPRITFSSTMNQKINAKHQLRYGVIANRLGYDLEERYRKDSTGTMVTDVNAAGSTYLVQSFFQWKYRISEKLTAVSGLHALLFTLNNTWSVEPRASLKYEAGARHAFSLGYGLHSQVQPIGMYFATQQLPDGKTIYPNKNLDLSKAHHLVLAHDFLLTEHLRMKTEVYYQALFNIPIRTSDADEYAGSYSMINSEGGYFTDSLTNTGTGSNKGVELTLERFMHNNFYMLLAGSLYDSKYIAADKKERSTRYNGNYSVSFTTGKEIIFKKGKKRVLGLNARFLYTGGKRTVPIDLAQSIAQGQEVQLWDRAFEDQNPYYFRLDTRFSLKTNRPKSTHLIALDFQNTTNRENVYGRSYNPTTKAIEYSTQTPLIPVLSYKITF